MLTEQRKIFIEEYLKLHCKNATQAAKNAGYSERTAHSQACDILKDSEVQGYLKMRKTQIEHELREEFIFEAQEAFHVMSKIMKNSEARDIDRISVAKDFLDRAGFKPMEKIELSKPIDETIKELEAFFDE
jgi:hypothetical protein